jgi:hypothetical protein
MFEDTPIPESDVVVQPRCVHCGMEHYALAVWAISHGHGACHNCGFTPPVFTNPQEYRDALRRARERRWGLA